MIKARNDDKNGEKGEKSFLHSLKKDFLHKKPILVRFLIRKIPHSQLIAIKINKPILKNRERLLFVSFNNKGIV